MNYRIIHTQSNSRGLFPDLYLSTGKLIDWRDVYYYNVIIVNVFSVWWLIGDSIYQNYFLFVNHNGMFETKTNEYEYNIYTCISGDLIS